MYQAEWKQSKQFSPEGKMKLRLSLPKILNVTLYTDGNLLMVIVSFLLHERPLSSSSVPVSWRFAEICFCIIQVSGTEQGEGPFFVCVCEKSNKFVSEKVFSRGNIGRLQLSDLAELTE